MEGFLFQALGGAAVPAVNLGRYASGLYSIIFLEIFSEE